MFTIQGFTVNTSEQARVFHLMAMLKGDLKKAQEAAWVISQLERAGK